MVYEKADPKHHGLGRWWYECGGLRHYYDCIMGASEDPEAVLWSLLDATPERGTR